MTNELDALAAWRREHAAALVALQEAQRAYHQSAVSSRQSAAGSRMAALEALDAARATLDDVRARMPRQ